MRLRPLLIYSSASLRGDVCDSRRRRAARRAGDREFLLQERLVAAQQSTTPTRSRRFRIGRLRGRHLARRSRRGRLQAQRAEFLVAAGTPTSRWSTMPATASKSAAPITWFRWMRGSVATTTSTTKRCRSTASSGAAVGAPAAADSARRLPRQSVCRKLPSTGKRAPSRGGLPRSRRSAPTRWSPTPPRPVRFPTTATASTAPTPPR